ncbi:MAG TPA: hypothetical protein VKZ65_01865 [Glycomyces sp.]|nr:hypothetical protein [Glycomyces sp.]
MNDLLGPFGRLRPATIIGVLAAAAAFWGFARLSGVDLLLWQIALLALAGLALSAIIAALRPDTEDGDELATRRLNTPTWRPFIEVNRWEDQLIFAETRPGAFEESNAKPKIVELAEERLRLRRGLSLREDPEQCRALLGEPTYAFLTEPVADCPDERRLHEHLTRIEAL